MRPPTDFYESVDDSSGLVPWRAPEIETGFLENFNATWDEMRLVGNIGSRTRSLDEAYRPLAEALNEARLREGRTFSLSDPAYLSPYSAVIGEDATYTQYGAVGGRNQQRERIFAEIRRRRQTDPNFLSGVADNADAFEHGVNVADQQRLGRIRDVQRRASTLGSVGSFAGGVVGSFEDPVNLATMPIGGPGRTVLGAIGRAAVENMIVEAVSQPLVAQNYAELGEDISLLDSVRSVLFAGGAGAAFRGGAIGIGAAARNAAPAYDRLIEGVFNSLPEGVQRRWADSSTVGDELLIDLLRATVPEENWTPDIRASVNVLERDAELAGASPFELDQAGTDAHHRSLAAALERIERGTPPIRVEAPPEPVAIPSPRAAGPMPAFERQWNAIIGNEGGTDRQGRFLTSPAGAIGPAQVMPGTAPYAARLAGLPWDNNRYRTDHAYNVALGQAYYREQLQTFGDPAMAAAAYNAGPGDPRRGRRGMYGALRAARAAGEPDNWEAYLPAETRQYVVDFRRRVGMADNAVAEAAPVARAADGGEAEIAALEVELAAREAGEEIAPSRAVDDEAEFEPVPVLRRELFGSDEDWAEAQVRLYGETNDTASFRRSGEDARSVLAGAGGIRDDEGHDLIRGRNLQRFVPRVGPLIRRSGMSIDEAGELLWERGFFGPMAVTARPSTAEVLEVIERAAHDDVFPQHMQADFELARRREVAPNEDEVWEEISGDVVRTWGNAAEILDTPLIRSRAVSLYGSGKLSLSEAYDEAIDELSVETIRAIRAETGLPDYDDPFEAEIAARATGAGDGRSSGEFTASRAGEDLASGEQVSAGTLAASLRANESAALAKFDDPASESSRAATDSIEHDILADIARDPTLAARRFIIEETGEEATLEAILAELDADRAAAAALRACL